MLGVEHSPSIPIVSKVPTLILGMDVSHGSPGQSDVPSIAAVNDKWTFFCVLLKNHASKLFVCVYLSKFLGDVNVF